jgi:xanthine dehydrogenase accessory factor
MTSADLFARADGLRARRTPFVLATVVRAERPTSAKAGDRALVLADGTVEGFVGGSCAESTVCAQGLRLLETGQSTLLRITSAPASEEAAGVVTVSNPCLSGGTLDIFLEANLPPTLVHVYGHAPVARALVEVGRALGYDVRAVAPTAPLPSDLTAVVVASHGRDEEPVLTAAARAGVPYVGLVASRRRGAGVLGALDLTDEQRAGVHTPAGLDIGARTPAEIALSVYAEVVALRPRRARAPKPTPPTVTEAVDPVCGMTIAVTAATRQTSHAGLPVYFCGPGCQHAFADEPAHYV